jgi:hypothetical protein
MDAQDILTGLVTAALSASLILIVVFPLLSALLSSGIRNRLGAAQNRVDRYFLDWRRSFF